MAVRTVLLGALALAGLGGGCQLPANRSGESRMATDLAPQWIAMLTSKDGNDVARACEALHSLGHAAVPALLKSAGDATPAAWSPPLFPGSSLLPAETAVGDMCLYLIEGIRVSVLAHSRTCVYYCADRVYNRHCAAKEYEQWWASAQSTDVTPYQPAVRWQTIAGEYRRRYTEEHGSIEPSYLPVLPRPLVPPKAE